MNIKLNAQIHPNDTSWSTFAQNLQSTMFLVKYFDLQIYKFESFQSTIYKVYMPIYNLQECLYNITEG